MNILSNLWIKVPQSVASVVASAVVGRAMLLLVDFIGCDTKPHHLSTTITHDPGIKWVKSRQRASNKPKSVKGTGQPRIKKSRKLKQKSSGRRVEEGLKKTHYDEDGTLENQLMLVPEFNKAVHSVPQFAVNISVTRYSDKTQIISGKNYEIKKASVIKEERSREEMRPWLKKPSVASTTEDIHYFRDELLCYEVLYEIIFSCMEYD